MQATPIANQPIAQDFPAFPHAFFCRPAEVVGPALVGCLLVKRQDNGSLLWGVIVETEAYSQDDPVCHGYRRRSPSNETLFGELGRFYIRLPDVEAAMLIEVQKRNKAFKDLQQLLIW